MFEFSPLPWLIIVFSHSNETLCFHDVQLSLLAQVSQLRRPCFLACLGRVSPSTNNDLASLLPPSLLNHQWLVSAKSISFWRVSVYCAQTSEVVSYPCQRLSLVLAFAARHIQPLNRDPWKRDTQAVQSRQ